MSIKISQFQEQSRGVFNAGEIRLTGETSLGIVNNHVGRLTQFMNNKHLTHSEVLAVKQAFVNALSREGKLDSNAINEVLRDLGLAPQENGSVAELHSRSIKPLSRQQVRQILDRYADTINKNLTANGQGDPNHFIGTAMITQRSTIDLTKETPLVTDVTFSQIFSPQPRA